MMKSMGKNLWRLLLLTLIGCLVLLIWIRFGEKYRYERYSKRVSPIASALYSMYPNGSIDLSDQSIRDKLSSRIGSKSHSKIYLKSNDWVIVPEEFDECFTMRDGRQNSELWKKRNKLSEWLLVYGKK